MTEHEDMSPRSQAVKATVQIAARYGFRLHRQHRHLIFRNDCGTQVVTSATPSDRRQLRNFEARCKRSASGLSLG